MKPVQYCRKCLRKLKKNHPKRARAAEEVLQSLRERGEVLEPHGCFDECPKKGLTLKRKGKPTVVKIPKDADEARERVEKVVS